jgi:2-phospho-L-lactate guanylyltransferase
VTSSASEPSLQWTLIVPIRDPSTGKSRLGMGKAVTEALALDALAAVGSTANVGRTIVVTDDQAWTHSLPAFAEVLIQRHSGLTAAVQEAVAASGSQRVAIMLGDLPALTSEDLAEALRLADAVPRGLVSDRRGSGSTLITALDGPSHQPAFGRGSAARHGELGYVDLEIAPTSTLRHDVDTPTDLDSACRRGVGPHTLRAMRISDIFAARTT